MKLLMWIIRRGVCFSIVAAAVLMGASVRGEDSGSVVSNGDLEKADPQDPARPAAWFKPDGLGIIWTNDPSSEVHGKCIRMDTTQTEKAMQAQWIKTGQTNVWNIPKPAGAPIANTFGLSYDSEVMQVVSGQAYRVTFDYKGSGGGKVWVRCYGQFRGERRQRYEKLVFCENTKGKWVTFSSVLHPTLHRPDVTEMKVMLFATHPPGLYWFDNIRLEPISAEVYEKEKKEGTKKRGGR